MSIENNTKHFLITIVQTISSIILWFLINILVGIYFKLGLIQNKLSVTNVLYYIVFVVGCILLAKYFIKKWKAVEFD